MKNRSRCALVVSLIVLAGCNSLTKTSPGAVTVSSYTVSLDGRIIVSRSQSGDSTGSDSGSTTQPRVVMLSPIEHGQDGQPTTDLCRDPKVAQNQCKRLRVGMTVAEVESIAGPIRNQLGNTIKLVKQAMSADADVQEARRVNGSVTALYDVSNGYVRLEFEQNAAGEYLLSSFEPLPMKTG